MKKGTISFDFYLPFQTCKKPISELPKSLSNLIQENEGPLTSITNYMEDRENYRITISIEKISK